MRLPFCLQLIPVLMLGISSLPAAPALQLGSTPTGLVVRFDLAPGETGQLQQSTNLVDWEDLGLAREGAGQTEDYPLGTPVEGLRFFRLEVTTPAVAPSAAEFQAAVVGTLLFDYSMTSATRFLWGGDEPGNWSYAPTGPNTGLLVFTYDEDDNNPASYREEVELMFETSSSGTYRYAEISGGVVGYTGQGEFTL